MVDKNFPFLILLLHNFDFFREKEVTQSERLDRP